MHEQQDVIIEPCSSSVVPVADQKTFDPITGYGPPPNGTFNDAPNVLEDDIKGSRQHSVNIFSTINSKLYAQFHTNMIIPITYRAGLDMFLLNKHTNCGNGLGVFIIERYNLPSISKHSISPILEYYSRTRGLSYDDTTIEDIIVLINNSKIKHGANHGALRSLEIRIITFISEKVIKDNQYTYVGGPGITICHSEMPPYVSHPYSESNMKDITFNNEEDSNSMAIDISIVTNNGNPRYIMLGNDVKVIRPITTNKKSVLPDGCTIITSRGNEVIDDIYFPMEDFEHHGLYSSREQCVTNGNRSLAVEDSKYKVELEKAKLELRKVNESNKKLTLEHDHKVNINAIEIDRKLVEYQLSVSSKEVDLIHQRIKANIDNCNKLVSLIGNKAGISIDIIKARNNISHANELANVKLLEQAARTGSAIMKLL